MAGTSDLFVDPSFSVSDAVLAWRSSFFMISFLLLGFVGPSSLTRPIFVCW